MFGPPGVDAAKLRAWTQKSIDRLARGLGGVAKARGVDVVAGHGRFEADGAIRVAREDAPPATLRFKHAIVATGSRPATLPGIEPGPRVWDSTAALALSGTPARLLVVGGGYIGLELGRVYAALGSEVTVVELLDGLLPGWTGTWSRRWPAGWEAVQADPARDQAHGGAGRGERGDRRARRRRRASAPRGRPAPGRGGAPPEHG